MYIQYIYYSGRDWDRAADDGVGKEDCCFRLLLTSPLDAPPELNYRGCAL